MNGVADRTIELLRPVEVLCYQVAYYLLGNAADAAAASEEALLAMYRKPCLKSLTEEELHRLAKDTAIRCSLSRAKAIKIEQDQSSLQRL
ncbi:DNA-directed RNA polymerase specialized sigma24 family protein [Paenibacillus phyllosphaerae]|uniref:DNA-directed RNA polymerase specialized sigma24 family protein n=1 Tax=Paenibacillus phyllosphaerae TaxID=274593 RepID=A0A7W5FLJ0_9BACL|nr:hypothetical protein [Paenibacillus phyllosphaerae]MBB3109047.1 DNA-directed RNA polymerase specialized sigma24 family protein [Paenibacillus phyllosphaerae]